MMMPNHKISFAAVVAFLLTVVGAMPANAQGDSVRHRPAIGGHSFTESVDVPSPFVRSFIRNRLGAGKSSEITSPVYEVGGEPVGGFQGNLLFAIIDFEYQYAIKPWIALRAQATGAGRLGSDTPSLLTEGVTMTTGFEIGWLIRLHEKKRTALALDLGLSDRAFTGINITRFVEDIVAEVPASLVRKTPTSRVSSGLRFAWAASPLLGVSATAHTGFGESVNRTEGDVWFWRFAAALDFDLRTKTSLPMGLALGHSYDSFPELGSDIAEGVHATFVRISYIGREDFLLSLDVSRDRIPVAGDQPDISGLSMTISLRYYI
jgi:hypothetical protein